MFSGRRITSSRDVGAVAASTTSHTPARPPAGADFGTRVARVPLAARRPALPPPAAAGPRLVGTAARPLPVPLLSASRAGLLLGDGTDRLPGPWCVTRITPDLKYTKGCVAREHLRENLPKRNEKQEDGSSATTGMRQRAQCHISVL